MLAQEKFSHADVQLQNMRAERDMLKTVEARLNQEKEGLIREARSQNMLLANLQAIQVRTNGKIHYTLVFVSGTGHFCQGISELYRCVLLEGRGGESKNPANKHNVQCTFHPHPLSRASPQVITFVIRKLGRVPDF